MLRISKLTDYATVLLGRLARDPAAQLTAAQLATETQVAATTVSKLLKQLQRAGLVQSTLGTHGGYRLARPAREISAAAILDALEGPVTLTACSAEHSQCEIESTCRVGGAWQRVNRAIRQSLQEVTLADLAGLETGSTHFANFDVKLRNGINEGRQS